MEVSVVPDFSVGAANTECGIAGVSVEKVIVGANLVYACRSITCKQFLKNC